MARIFLCHASEDKPHVREVYQRLAEIDGFEPWLDERDLLPGQIWEREIPRALRDSDFILIFLSRISVAKRGYVQREMKMALDVWEEMPEGRIHTIPVRIDDCDVPEPFRRYHYANLSETDGFDRLVQAMKMGLGQRHEVAASPPPLPKSPPLERKKKRVFRLSVITLLTVLIAAFVVLRVREYNPTPATKPGPIEPEPVSVSPVRPVETSPPDRLPAVSAASSLPNTLTNSLGMPFVLIPAGEFMMGTPKDQLDAIAGDDKRYRVWIENETPAHRVVISQPFYMGKYEVTQAEWKAVMGTNPSHFEGDDHPVDTVSWEEAQDFIKKLNEKEEKEKQTGGVLCRLPTEAEWEYAARAKSQGRYHFGDDVSRLDDYAWYDKNAGGKTHSVGQRKPNPWGLHDMHGNVYEWVQDWSGNYTADPVTNPAGPGAGADRVIRGGSWNDSAQVARSALRNRVHPGFRNADLGFRCLSSGRERGSGAQGKP